MNDSLALGILLKSLSHAGHLADNRLDAALATHDLSIAQLGVLKVLSAAEKPLPLSQIAGKLTCVRSNVTQLIDRMEADGLVRRVPDTLDRRSTGAMLTEKGRQRCALGMQEELKVERELFGELSTVEQAQLHDLLHRFSKLRG
jgi:DNA-binding MarR family transcriptional regulator